jgi:hypothetical protein
MKIKINAFSFYVVLSLSMTGLSVAQDDTEEVEELGRLTHDPTLQPLVRVIANPERFQNQVITVTGYFMRGTHVNNLYLDMESCTHFEDVNSILLDGKLYDEDFVPCQRETVKGKFNYSPDNRYWRNNSDMVLEIIKLSDQNEK